MRLSRGRRATPRAQLAAAAQSAFPFLSAVPTREVRRQARARRPHLRARTQPAAEVQLVLPFRPSAGDGLLTPERAEAMERTLVEVRAHPEGSPRQRAAESRLLQLLEPFLGAEVQRAWASHERTHLSREDLLQEARLHALKLWRHFTPGKAGPGRTLYPAYVGPAVRQRLGTVLADAKLVGPTQWGRKIAARARRRAAREELSYEEALRKEKADPATVLALSTGATRVHEREAESLPDEADLLRDGVQEELGAEAAALAALKRLPRRERMAVAVPLGLSRLKLSDSRLARHLKCTLAELLEARARGLATLRMDMSRRVEC